MPSPLRHSIMFFLLSFLFLGTLKYDVKLTEPSGNEYYYIKGNLNVSEGYTA